MLGKPCIYGLCWRTYASGKLSEVTFFEISVDTRNAIGNNDCEEREQQQLEKKMLRPISDQHFFTTRPRETAECMQEFIDNLSDNPLSWLRAYQLTCLCLTKWQDFVDYCRLYVINNPSDNNHAEVRYNADLKTIKKLEDILQSIKYTYTPELPYKDGGKVRFRRMFDDKGEFTHFVKEHNGTSWCTTNSGYFTGHPQQLDTGWQQQAGTITSEIGMALNHSIEQLEK